jgi:hypothetical protein
MPFIWIEYGPFNVVSKKVYTRFDDCMASIEARIDENPDDFPYKDFCPAYEGDLETKCKEAGWVIYTFYDDYDKEFQIHWVDIE